VLVRCYHGFGDTLQFIRFVGALRWAQGEEATIAETAALIGKLDL